MTVDAFRLKNFMAFRDTGWIELRAITLLFGRNSSGKSAIIRALRLLKQSLYNGQGDEVLRFAVEGQLDLGDFQAALHKRNDFENYADKVAGQKIAFQFRGDLLNETLETIHNHVNWWLSKNGYPQLNDPESQPILKQIEFSLEYGQTYDPVSQTLVTQIVGIHIDCPWPILSSILDHPEPLNFLSASRVPPLHFVKDDVSLPEAPNENQFGYMEWYREWYWESEFGLEELALQEVATREDTNSKLDWRDIVISAIEGFFPTLIVPTKSTTVLYHGMNDFLSHRLNAIMEELSQNITKFLEIIEYLEPIRPAPERTYMLKRADIERWQRMGWRNWLNALQEGSPATPPDMTEINLDEVSKSPLSIWMDTFELGQLLHVRRFSDVPKTELVAQVFILGSTPLNREGG